MRIAGTLKQLGQGRYVAHRCICRSMIQVGNHAIRGVRISEYLSSYLLPGHGVALGIQRILWMRFVFAVAIGTRVYRAGECWTAVAWMAGAVLTTVAAVLTVVISPIFLPLLLLFGYWTWQCMSAFCIAVLFPPLSQWERVTCCDG